MSTMQKQDARKDDPVTGREGDGTSANPTDAKQSTTGLDKKAVEKKAERERAERVPAMSEAGATAHRLVREAMQGTLNAEGKWVTAADACKVYFKTYAMMNKKRDIIYQWIAEGLREEHQVALAQPKGTKMTDEQKKARKAAQDAQAKNFERMLGYAFPNAHEKAKVEKVEKKATKPAAQATEEGEEASEDATTGKGKSIDERALALVVQALEYLQKNTGFGFDAVKAATHLAAARSIMNEMK